MRRSLVVAVVGLFGCTPASSGVDDKPPVSPTQPEPASTADPDADPVEEPDPPPEAGTITVQMTSATLADDCGGGPKTPPAEPKPKPKQRSKRKGDVAKGARARRACEQSSIQLAITAPADAKAASMSVKSVELLLESGDKVGALQTRAPSVWSNGDGYEPWDEKVAPSQELSVSYALSQPDWSQVEDRWNQTYTVKAVVSIAGADQTVQQRVEVHAPTSLPPNVKT